MGEYFQKNRAFLCIEEPVKVLGKFFLVMCREIDEIVCQTDSLGRNRMPARYGTVPVR